MSLLSKGAVIVFAITLLSACGKKTSDEYILAAQEHIAQNNNDAAILELKNAIQQDSRSAEARFELGKLYLAQKQFESAEKELNRAMEYGYSAVKVIPLLTRAYQKTGAHSALSKLEHDNAGLTLVERAEVGFFKVQSLVRLEKIDEARLLIEELAELETGSVYKGLIMAYPLVLDKDYDNALLALKKLREQSPLEAEVLKLLAQLHLALGKPQDAAEVFTDYVQYHPEDAQGMFVLAKLLVDLGKTKEAEPYVDKLLALNPQNPLLNQLKSAARAAEKDYVEAQKYAEVAIQNGMTDPSVRLIAGYSAYQIQDYEAANHHLSFIANVLPTDHPGLKLLASSQLQLGLDSELSEVLSRVEKIDEQDAPLFSKASYQLLRSGYVKDATQLIERSGAISSSAEDLTRLGLLQLSINNLEGIVNLEQAVEKSPQLISAKTTLARAYLATEQFDKALALADTWLAEDSNDLMAYMLVGEIKLKQQAYDEAKTQFEKVLSIDKNYAAAKLALINIQRVQGNSQKSQEQLESVLAAHPNYAPALASYYLMTKQNKEQNKALTKMQKAYAAAPENMELRLLMARLYMMEGQYEQALKTLDGLAKLDNVPADYWKIKGQALIRSNQRKAAIEHYDAWLQLYAFDKDATIGKLLLLDSQNDFSGALQLTQAFLAKRDDVQIQLLETHFLIMNSEYTAGQVAYDALPENTKALPLVKGFLARLQLAEKKPELALNNAQIAYEANASTRNLLLLVVTLEQLNKQGEARALLDKHVSKTPSDITANMLLAERQLADDTAAAIVTYEATLKVNADNYIARNNLAYLYLQNGDIANAKKHASRAVELQGDNAAALDTLAQVHVAEKDYRQALKYYERAVNDKMQNEEIYLNYVEALFLDKQDALAKRKLEQREMKQAESITRLAELKSSYGL